MPPSAWFIFFVFAALLVAVYRTAPNTPLQDGPPSSALPPPSLHIGDHGAAPSPVALGGQFVQEGTASPFPHRPLERIASGKPGTAGLAIRRGMYTPPEFVARLQQALGTVREGRPCAILFHTGRPASRRRKEVCKGLWLLEEPDAELIWGSGCFYVTRDAAEALLSSKPVATYLCPTCVAVRQ